MSDKGVGSLPGAKIARTGGGRNHCTSDPLLRRSNDSYPSRAMSEWWRSGVIYEIAPLSFQDADGDGKGDLKGIESRAGYLQWLSMDAVWISPFFPSPMLDFGY